MHTRYPLTRVEDINEDLALAIAKVLGATVGSPALSLNDIIEWHHNANPAPEYTNIVHTRILELANALQLHSITNGRPELYETFETDSERHNKLLMSLGIYTEEDRWDDDFHSYRTVEWGDTYIDLGVPYAYHPDAAEKAYRIHRVIGKADRAYGLSIEHYEFIETVHVLGELEELGALEEGIVKDIDADIIKSAIHIHKTTDVPLRWALATEEIFRSKSYDSIIDIFETEQLHRLAKNQPEDTEAFYLEWVRGPYPLGTFDERIECYLDIREAGYPLTVAVKALQFDKSGPEVLELFETLGVEYAFQLL